MDVFMRCDGSESAKYFCRSVEWIKGNKELSVTSEKSACYVITTKKKSLDWLKEELTGMIDEEVTLDLGIHVVVVDFFKDSMITTKYISDYVHRGLQQKVIAKILVIEFKEMDQIIRIEDEYNHRLSFKRLSKSYQKAVEFIACDNTKPRKKQKRRDLYADSTVV